MTNPNPNSEYHISSTGLSMSGSDRLDVHFLAMQTEYEEMLRWVDIQPNWNILDAASGSGSFLPLMTELVGSGGKVSAIDMDPENVRVI
jgi:ubiquinone/menaquinone biosynthesis C-methylase UbiE